MTISAPSVHRALLARIPQEKGEKAWRITHSHPVPTIDYGSDEVLIKTAFVGLNPVDWQSVEFKFGINHEAKAQGRDGSGIVVAIGSGASARFKVGDRVWFCANSGRQGTGAFQEYSVHSSAEVGHTPFNISDDEAATLGTGLITAGVALFKTLGFHLPSPLDHRQPSTSSLSSSSSKAPWILIWGAAGITGVYLIQLAHLIGYRVICLASPSNHAYVKSLGAEVVLDRWISEADVINEIRLATDDNVRIAIDNVGPHTTALCIQALQGSLSFRAAHNLPLTREEPSTPGKLVAIAGTPKVLPIPTSDAVRGFDSLRISFSTTFYGHPDFSTRLLDWYYVLLKTGLVRPARLKLVDGGLEGIEKGLEDIRFGRAPGGVKLVSRLLSQHHTPVVVSKVQPSTTKIVDNVELEGLDLVEGPKLDVTANGITV